MQEAYAMLVREIIYVPKCCMSYKLGVYIVMLGIYIVRMTQLYIYLRKRNVTIIYIHTESSVDQYICYMSVLLYIEYLIKKNMYNDF
jgi:hypothetical protein